MISIILGSKIQSPGRNRDGGSIHGGFGNANTTVESDELTVFEDAVSKFAWANAATTATIAQLTKQNNNLQQQVTQLTSAFGNHSIGNNAPASHTTWLYPPYHLSLQHS